MKSKLSYEITVLNKNVEFPKHEYLKFKTLKELKLGVMKLLDTKEHSFEVKVKYNFDPKRFWKPYDISWEFWFYDHEIDGASTYNLRRNKWYKDIRRIERQLRPIMLRYNYGGKNENI